MDGFLDHFSHHYELGLTHLGILLPRVIWSLIFIGIFYAAKRGINKFFQKVRHQFFSNYSSFKLLSKLFNMAGHCVALIVVLAILGVDISGLITGLGLMGFAIGFAFKDLISNVISGAMIAIYKPFKVGDIIRIGKEEGRVHHIDLRYTVIKVSEEQWMTYIPNSKILTEVITVSS